MSAALDKSTRPRTIGGYRLDERIGSGAMGSVYRAFDLKLGRVVALKVVSAQDETSELFLRFVREGAAAARIRHPNVVQVYDAGSESGYAYLAMQLLDGETLAETLAHSERLQLPRAVDVILPICAGLAAAHAAGVLHRDLKPANIFLAKLGRSEPEPYLLDFGISKLDGPVDAALTQNSRLLGTPFYIAPEQADGAPGSALSDQYSLALCLYECLLGVRPFEQHKDSLMKLLRHVAEGNIPSPRQLDASIPLGLDAVLTRALSTQPKQRYPSMQDFGAALLPYASVGQRQIWHGAFGEAADTPAQTDARVSTGRSPTEVHPSHGVDPFDPMSEAPPYSAERSSFSQKLPGQRRDPISTKTNLQLDHDAPVSSVSGVHVSAAPPSSRRFNPVGVEKHERAPGQRSLVARVFFGVIAISALAMSVLLVVHVLREVYRSAGHAPAAAQKSAASPR